MARSPRSRSYPAISLPEALEVLRKQVEGLGWGAYDRDAIAQALGYMSGTSGVAVRKISALAQFGLLHKQRGLYEPTPLAKTILNEEDEVRLWGARRTAFLHPPLFREIVQRHLKDGHVPRLLAHSLRDDRIASNARDEVARIFMESALHARVMDSNGSFERDYLARMGEPIRPEAMQAWDPEPMDGAFMSSSPSRVPAPDRQVLRLYLTDGKIAELLLPLRVNDQDLAILRMQLNVLEIQVQVNKPAPPLRWVPRPERGSGRS